MNRLVLYAIAVALGLLCIPIWANAAFADRRVALVVGNSAYQNAPVLPNPAKDARAIAAMFQQVGFDVVSAQYDIKNLEFKRAIRQFEDAAADADIAVVYYAGHGIEIHGTNYLVPVDAKLASDRDAEDEAITLDRLIESVDGAKRLRVVILDACRDNPFTRTMNQQRAGAVRGISSGLGMIEPSGINTLIAYAAKAGSVAQDGNANHSPFALALLDNLFVPGLDIRLAFGRVRDEVLKKTGNQQEPFVYGSLGGANISLVPPGPSKPSEAVTDVEGEKSDYTLVERIGTKGAWEVFLHQHPAGFYSELARAHLAKLEQVGVDQSNTGAQPGNNFGVATRDVQPEQKRPPQITSTIDASASTGPPNTWLWWWPQWR
jgi:Caspase domain